MRAVIDMKLPSLNEYVRACRSNALKGAKFKKEYEYGIGWYLTKLPTFEKPVKIHFHWIEENRRRDYDNIAFAKKFILDAMVKCGKLKDDNRRYVVAFTDTFSYGEKTKVVMDIEEVEDNEEAREFMRRLP